MNIVEQVFRQAPGTSIALQGDDQAVTYARLRELVEATACQLRKAGALDSPSRVARVGLACPDGVAHVVLGLAVLLAGGCLIPIASELVPAERDTLLHSVALDAVIVAAGSRWHRPLGRPVELEVGGLRATALRGVRQATDEPPVFDEEELAALHPAFIRFSSGTTGMRKGVVLSHATLAERITAANRGLHIGPADRVIWILPMAHHFAVSILLYLVQGATIVLVASHLAPDVLEAGRRHHGTVLYAAPFHHALLAAEPLGLPWPGLRLAVSTAAALPLATARAFDARFGTPLSQALGIIEVGLPAINLDAPREKPTSVGRLLPDFAVKLLDPSGCPRPPGEVGEIWLRGPGMLDAYLSPWRRREAALLDGWFPTGDLGHVDADGHLFLVGRTRTVINVAGMKCFPEEIEAVLHELPEVHAVRVIPRPHERVGAVPVAEIVPADTARPPTAARLAAHCRERLAHYKVPVEFRFVSSLPQTASGKIRRSAG